MSKVAKNNDPALWETVKAEGDKGGRPSQWSVRKA